MSAPAPGFDDPVHGAQRVFRSLMDGMAWPGTIHHLADQPAQVASLNASTAAVLLTLADTDTPIWLDGPFASDSTLTTWLAFHCAAPQTTRLHAAGFAILDGWPAGTEMASFAQGTGEYPDRSTTIIIQVDSLSSDTGWCLHGPGIETHQTLGVGGLPPAFEAQWEENAQRFPLGIDVIFCAGSTLACLPRTTTIMEA